MTLYNRHNVVQEDSLKVPKHIEMTSDDGGPLKEPHFFGWVNEMVQDGDHKWAQNQQSIFDLKSIP